MAKPKPAAEAKAAKPSAANPSEALPAKGRAGVRRGGVAAGEASSKAKDKSTAVAGGARTAGKSQPSSSPPPKRVHKQAMRALPPAGDDDALVADLEATLETLSAMDQNSIGPELGAITAKLVNLSLLESESKRVRALGARCLVDVLYLHAPERPYEDATLKRVFGFLIDSLHGLEQEPDSVMFSSAAYVLERAVLCGLTCLLVDLPDVPGDGGVPTAQLTIELFDTVLGGISPSHGPEIERNAVQVLSSYLEEADEISPQLLDALLVRLLPDIRKDSHRARDVARAIVEKCADKLRSHITTLLNSIISGGFSGDLGYEADALTTDLKEKVDDLILELYPINPTLVVAVLPNVESMLDVDDEATRVRAVRLLSKIMLKSTDAQIIDNDRMLSALIQRIKDTSPDVRLEVTRMAGWALVRKDAPPALGARVLAAFSSSVDMSMLEIALVDPAVVVRSEAVEVVAMLLNSDDSDADERAVKYTKLVEALAGRMQDKDPAIVGRAMDGLAWAFSKRVASKWAEGGKQTWCTWIPEAILNSSHFAASYSEEDALNLSFTRLTLLDQALFGKREDVKLGRARVVAKVWQHCNAKARDVLVQLVFAQRRATQSTISGAVAQSAQNKRTSKDAAVFAKALAMIPAAQGRAMAEQVWTLTDGRIFDRLTQVCNPNSTAEQLNEARKDLVERVGAGVQSQKGNANDAKLLARALCRVAGMHTLGVEDVSAILDSLQDDELVEPLSEITAHLAKFFPSVFESHGENLAKVLQHACETKRGKPAETEAALMVDACSSALRHCKLKFRAPRSLTDILKTICSGGVKHLGMQTSIRACKALFNVNQDALVSLASHASVEAKSLPAHFVVTCLSPDSRDNSVAESLLDLACKNCKAMWPSTVRPSDLDVKVVSVKTVGAEIVRRLSKGNDDEKHAVTTQSLLLMLRRFVADGGDPWGAEVHRKSHPEEVLWPPNTEEQYAQLRLMATKWLTRIDGLAMGRKALMQEGKSIHDHVARGAQRFVERGRIAMDPVARVREEFANALTKHVLDKGLNLSRDGALLCLVASFGGANAQASTDFKSLVKTLAVKSAEFRLNDDEKHATLSAPECILPNLVYLLAHHPLLPAGVSEAAHYVGTTDGQRLLTRPLVTFFDALVAAHGAGARMDGSVSFMLALLASMRNRVDARDPGDVRVHLMGDFTRVLIQQYVKRYSPDALQTYSGHVPLPQCFAEPLPGVGAPKTPLQALSSGSGAGLPSPVSYLPPGFELTAVGKGGNKRTSSSSAAAAAAAGSLGPTGSSSKKAKRVSSASASAKKKKKNEKRASIKPRTNDEDNEDDSRVRRTQPRRASAGAGRKSYAGYFSSSSSSSSDSDDALSESEE